MKLPAYTLSTGRRRRSRGGFDIRATLLTLHQDAAHRSAGEASGFPTVCGVRLSPCVTRIQLAVFYPTVQEQNRKRSMQVPRVIANTARKVLGRSSGPETAATNWARSSAGFEHHRPCVRRSQRRYAGKPSHTSVHAHKPRRNNDLARPTHINDWIPPRQTTRV